MSWQPRSSLPVRGRAAGFWEGYPGNLDRHFVKSERQKRILIILSFHEDVNGVDLQLMVRRGQANKELNSEWDGVVASLNPGSNGADYFIRGYTFNIGQTHAHKE